MTDQEIKALDAKIKAQEIEALNIAAANMAVDIDAYVLSVLRDEAKAKNRAKE